MITDVLFSIKDSVPLHVATYKDDSQSLVLHYFLPCKPPLTLPLTFPWSHDQCDVCLHQNHNKPPLTLPLTLPWSHDQCDACLHQNHNKPPLTLPLRPPRGHMINVMHASTKTMHVNPSHPTPNLPVVI